MSGKGYKQSRNWMCIVCSGWIRATSIERAYTRERIKSSDKSIKRAIYTSHPNCLAIKACVAELFYLPWQILSVLRSANNRSTRRSNNHLVYLFYNKSQQLSVEARVGFVSINVYEVHMRTCVLAHRFISIKCNRHSRLAWSQFDGLILECDQNICLVYVYSTSHGSLLSLLLHNSVDISIFCEYPALRYKSVKIITTLRGISYLDAITFANKWWSSVHILDFVAV